MIPIKSLHQAARLSVASRRDMEVSDKYGRCERCGSPIDPERLEILPATTLCADCARAESAKTAFAADGTPHVIVQN
jgi:RNA polymerase-binding transcription factor DksA